MRDNLLPGSLVFSGEQKMEKPHIRCFDYTKLDVKEFEAAAIGEVFPFARKEDSVTWINVDGIHDVALFKAIQDGFEIHPLLLEDVLNSATRPKFEAQENHALVVLKAIRFDPENCKIILEQLSFILGAQYVLSFQERTGHYFDSVRDRLRNSKGRIRNQGADYLCYALIDAVVDNYYMLPEMLSDTIETLEAKVLSRAKAEDLAAIYNLKREVVLLDRALWPVLELVNGMRKGESELISDSLGPYLQDLSDHAQQLISSTQAIREMTANLQDLYMSTISNNMNQVMKVLAIVATIFIPLTFIAGVFGMNFEFMPELKARYGYFITLGLMALIALGMVYYFKKIKWL
jgi:magnesium transporter